MRRIGLLVLLACVGFLPIGCGNSTNPTSSASSSSSSSSSFSYPFFANYGSYFSTSNSTFSNGCGFPWNIPATGGFSDITGVAIGGGYIFAGDDDFGTIQIFDMNGNPVTWFYPLDAEGDFNCCFQFPEPEGMKVANDRLYVADYSYGYINVYNIVDLVAQASTTAFCNFVNAYASYQYDGDAPYDVDVDSKGNMYVAEDDNTGIMVIAPDFNEDVASDSCTCGNWGSDQLAEINTGVTVNGDNSLSSPSGITVDPAGQHVYLTDYGSTKNVVQVYSYNGGATLTSTGVLGGTTGAPSTVAGKFDAPWGVRLDNQGNLLVVDNGSNLIPNYPRVQRLTTGGSVLNVLGNTTTTGELYSPAYVAVDSNNNLYVTDQNVGTINVYSGK